MAVPHDEHERTLAFAEIALGQIRALGQTGIAAQFRNLVQLRDRLQPAAQPVDQRGAGQKGRAQRSRSRADLRHLHRREPAGRPHRLGRLARARRDQAGDGHDRRRRRLGDQLFGSLAELASEKLAQRQRWRGAARRSSSTWCRAPRRWSSTTRSSKRGWRRREQEIEQLQQNLEAVRTESLTDPLTTLSQPQIFRYRAGQGASPKRKRRTSRCRC